MYTQCLRLQRSLHPRVPSALRRRAPSIVARTGTVTRASGRQAEVLKAEIASLQQEAADVESQARDALAKVADLQQAVLGLERLALKCLDRQDNERAREIMIDKQEAEQHVEQAQARAEDLVALEVKLADIIQAKRTDLLKAGLASGVEHRDDKAGVRISIGKDGKPTFERTGIVNETPTPPPPDVSRDPWFSSRDAASSTPPAQEPQRQRQYDAFTFRLSAEDEMKSMAEISSYTPTVDELLREGDRRLDEQFLELERKQLEKSLRASPSVAEGSADLDTVPHPSSSAAAARDQQAEQKEEAARREAHAKRGDEKVTVAEWVTMGQNSLMDGALAELKDDFNLQYEDAGRALVAVTNARIRGADPAPEKLLSLIVHTLRAPAHHESGIFWGVAQAPGAAQLSQNIKLAIFGAALQLTIEDLLSGMSKFLPENPVQRSVEARALLVTLAAAIDLRSADASDFAVQMLCRAIRTCLLNALASLRHTMSTEDRASLDRAEADLKALYHLLSALPVALPLAMGHAAALEATEQLRGVMSPVDARRLDKLYRLICGEDGTSTMLRVILGPLLNELD